MTRTSKNWLTERVGRRTVLKGMGATAAAAGLGQLAFANAPRGIPRDHATYMSSSHWGVFRAHVEAGRVTYVLPFEGDPAPTPMLQSFVDRLYSNNRVKAPMVRAGFLRDGANSDTTMRGRDEWVRVSWDEALDLVASEVTRVRETYDNSAIYAGSYGWYSTGKLHAAPTLLRRFLTLNGGFVGSIGDYSTAAAQVIMPHVVGRLEVYEQQTAWPVVVDNSELVVLWSADPMVTNQIGWNAPDHGGMVGFQQLKEKGTEVISINPIVTDSARYLGAETVQVRPNTDVAMMLGIAHAMVDEGLHDAAFLDRYTFGFDRFAAYLTGESDGQPKTPEWAEGITGVPAETMRTLARKFAGNRTMLMGGWGMQRQHYGEQRHWMLVTLASMIGQIGLPGGGFGFSYHYSNGGSPSAVPSGLRGIPAGVGSEEGPDWLDTASEAIPVARISDMLLNPGKTIDFNGSRITYPDTKMIFWAGGNPFHHHQDRNQMIRAWQKPETIVVNEPWWTATAKFADIVLPAATGLERNDLDLVGDYSGQYVIAKQKAIDPVFESRTDFDIFADLAERLGTGEGFTEGKSEMDWLREFYANVERVSAAGGVDVPDFDTFWEQGYVQMPVTEAGRNYVRYADFREDPIGNILGTPSGRIEIFSTTIEGFDYDDCPPHPTWMEPIEWSGSEKAAEYPLQLITPHPRDRLHSQLDNTWIKQWLNIDDREPLWMHPADAEARGLSNGDVVRVFSERGAVLAGLLVTDRIREGVVALSEGAWYDPEEPGVVGSLCKRGDVNVLTVDIGTSKLAQGNCGHTMIVEVEKYEGTPPAVTAHVSPKGA
jgi:trimethylamine-N-oxide reductase (cytochrome c)